MQQLPQVIPEKGEQVKCIVKDVEGLTEGKTYDVVYNGSNHSVVYDDNGKHTMISRNYNVGCFEDMRNYVATRQDLDDLLKLGIIEINRELGGVIKWLDAEYDGVFNDIKELAEQRKLKADVNGIYDYMKGKEEEAHA